MLLCNVSKFSSNFWRFEYYFCVNNLNYVMKRAFSTHSCILCGFSKNKDDAKRSFFTFPKKESLRKQWIEKCRLHVATNTSSARLCSNHFQEGDYSNFGESSAKRIRLKKNAVPSIFVESSSLEVQEKEVMKADEEKCGEGGHYCMVCKKRTKRPTKRLPTDENEAERWVQFFQLDTCTKKDVRICEKHFENHEENIHMRQVTLHLVPPSDSESASSNDESQSSESDEERQGDSESASSDDASHSSKSDEERQGDSESASSDDASHSSERDGERQGDSESASSDDASQTSQSDGNVVLQGEESVLKSVVSAESSSSVSNNASQSCETVENVELQAGEFVLEPSVSAKSSSPVLSQIAAEVNPILSIPGSDVTPEKLQKNTLPYPRYPNDIRTPHLSTPRRAKRCLELTRDVIAKQRQQLKLTKQQLQRARKKIKSLQDIIEHLRKECQLTEDMKESLMVPITVLPTEECTIERVIYTF